jgi:hypothetical protein
MSENRKVTVPVGRAFIWCGARREGLSKQDAGYGRFLPPKRLGSGLGGSPEAVGGASDARWAGEHVHRRLKAMSVVELRAPQPGPEPPAEAIVSIEKVTRRYGEGDTAVDALRGVSLDIERGKLTAVMGRRARASRR